MRAYTVQWDYRADRLNGKDGVVWAEGSTVVLHEDDADWVNRDREGTLEPAAELDESVPDPDAPETRHVPAEVPATTPAAEQTGGRPKSRARRDSAS